MGGWDPAWDILDAPTPRPLRPQKLHKNQRDRAKRAEKVRPVVITVSSRGFQRQITVLLGRDHSSSMFVPNYWYLIE